MGAENDSPTPSIEPVQEDKLPVPGSADEVVSVAANDIVEELVNFPKWGFALRLRSFTAAQQATIRQIGFQQQGEGIVINWALMEQTQFKMGVVEPAFSDQQVKALHMKSGSEFQRAIKWLDEHSSFDKSSLEEIKDEFPGSDEPAEV